MATRLFELRMPVMECGYMNSASAEPRASVAYAVNCAGRQQQLVGGHGGENLAEAAEAGGMTTTATMTVT